MHSLYFHDSSHYLEFSEDLSHFRSLHCSRLPQMGITFLYFHAIFQCLLFSDGLTHFHLHLLFQLPQTVVIFLQVHESFHCPEFSDELSHFQSFVRDNYLLLHLMPWPRNSSLFHPTLRTFSHVLSHRVLSLSPV